MKCPVCRCDVGNQQVCPYCGATVYLQDSGVIPGTYVPGNHGKMGGCDTGPEEVRELHGTIRKMKTQMQMMLVLQGANFVLIILLLLVLALS